MPEVRIDMNVVGAEQAAQKIAGVGQAATDADRKLKENLVRIYAAGRPGTIPPGPSAATARADALGDPFNLADIDARLAVLSGAGRQGRRGGGADLNTFTWGADRITPGGGDGNLAAGLEARWRSQLFQLIGLSAAGQAFRGLGQGLKELAEDVEGANSAFTTLFRNITEHIPIIGGVVQGVAGIADVVSGEAGRRGFARMAGRRIETAGLVGQEYATGAAAARAAELEFAEARIGQAGAEQFLAGLTPERLASYRPVDPTGRVREGLGSAQMAADLAQRAAATAEGRRQLSAAEAAGARGRFGDVQGQAEELTRQIAAQERRQRLLQSRNIARDLRAEGFTGDPLTEAARIGRDFERAGSVDTLRTELEQVDKQRITLIKELEDATRRQLRVEQEGANASFNAKQKLLDVEKARLQILDDQVDRARQTSVNLALGGPGAAEEMLEIARAGQRDFGGLPPQLQQRLVQFAPDVFQPLARQLAQQNPAILALQREFLGGELPAQEAQRAAQADQLVRAGAENQAALAKRAGDILDPAINNLFDVIWQGVAVRIEAKLNQERQQNQAGQQRGRQAS